MMILTHLMVFTIETVQRFYTDLPPHAMITYSVLVIIINAIKWTPLNTVSVKIDGQPFSITHFNTISQSTCGGINLPIVGKLAHSSSTLMFEVAFSIQTPSGQAYAVGQVDITLHPVSTITTMDYCAYTPTARGDSQACPCQTGQYKASDGTCQSCNSACETCYGPLDTDCYTCRYNIAFDGNSCTSTAPANCLFFIPQTNQCSQCLDNLYLDWTGKCLDTCPSRYYPDGGTGEYRVCNPCQTSDYYYQNDTCASTCSSPMVPRTEGTNNFCDYPCSYPDPLMFYDEVQKVCILSCDYPMMIKDTVFCVSTLTEADAKLAQALADTASAGTYVVTATAISMSLLSYSDPAAFSLVTLAKMLQYIKFIAIKYPAKLRRSLDLQKPSNGMAKFAPNIPENLRDNIVEHQLPPNFERYGLPSSFLVNFWQPLFVLLILMVIIVFFMIVEQYTTKGKTLNKICQKALQMLKWNFTLMFFTTFFDDIVLYTSFDLRTSDLDSGLSILSWMSCLVVNTVVIGLIVKALFVVRAVRVSKPRANRIRPINQIATENIEEKQRDFEVTFKTYQDNSFLGQAFLPVFLIRVYLFALVIAYLFQHPLTQAILINILSIFMLLYIILKRPFKEKLTFFQYIVQEGLIFIVNLSILILAIIDHSGATAYGARFDLQNIVLACNTIFLMSGSAFLVLMNIMKVWDTYQTKKAEKKKKVQRIAPKDSGSKVNEIFTSSKLSKPGLKKLEPVRVSQRISVVSNYGHEGSSQVINP